MKSIGASIAWRPREEIEDLLQGLSENAQAALPFLFDVWGMRKHQLPPEGDWTTWLILGGRGAGKTRAGAEWIRSMVEGATPLAPGACKRVALVGATLDEARDVMVRGESGLIACSPPDRRPEWNESRRTLTWVNGAEATCFSASSPEKLRGPQFDCAWVDELGKWPKPDRAWDMLQFALRLGDHPRQVVTTTPRANPVLEALITDEGTVTVSAGTRENRANLAKGFLEKVTKKYGGTSQGREELDGVMVLDRPGALWTRSLIEAARVREAPKLSRTVVAVDPPVSAGENADECGIIVAGRAGDNVYVLADRSSRGDTPQQWAMRAAAAYDEFNADRVVFEVNQGGAMVETVVRGVAPLISFSAVHANKSKAMRAEPISALYEQGLVKHVGGFPALEDQMRAFGSEGFKGSPDRVDALVWAIWSLMHGPQAGGPSVRQL
ncbi:DNA-packaging protein [Pikeienuella piscinae]|uniref:DNA-packaging protein n=1 Tax=Pikeienuella piscinae TaxID=2748098 RepID=A0A7L5BSY0_9RHOB|nr:terminase family protein [Pikeienuella piscinae]QIE54515.1 DNA-packaging protein [Pikeienuella piscinae]